MAFVYRLAFLIILITNSAFASFPATSTGTKFKYGTAVSGCTGLLGNTPQEACQNYQGATNCQYQCSPSLRTETTYGPGYEFSRNPISGACTNHYPVVTCQSTLSCPSNSTLSGSSCTCNSGFVESGSSCVEAPCPEGQSKNPFAGNICMDTCGTSEIKSYTEPYSARSYSYCKGDNYNIYGCAVTMTGNATCVGSGTEKLCGSYTIKGTGDFCDPLSPYNGTLPVAELSADDKQRLLCIQQGREYAYLNGQVMCVVQGDGVPIVTETKAPDGSITTQNPDGSSTTNKTDGTSVAISGDTVTITNTDSSTTITTKSQYCLENPSSIECNSDKTGVSGGEGCDSPPVCSGDPVQCAQLNQTWKIRCTYDPELSGIGDAAVKSGQDGTDKLGGGNGSTPLILTTNKFLGDGTCPADATFSVVGQSFTIPYSKMCPTLDLLGNLIVLFAGYAAMRIIFL